MVRNQTIDIAKFFAALLVIAIHTSLFEDVNGQLYFWFNRVLCRLAVPFFAATTGFYLCRAIYRSGSKAVFRQWKKQFRIYMVWSTLYFLFLLPMWLQDGYMSWGNLVGYLKGMVFSGSYFHLWYILDVLYALPVFYIVVWFCGPRCWFFLSVVLWIICAAGYAYSPFFPSFCHPFLDIVCCDFAIVKAQFVILPILLSGGVMCRCMPQLSSLLGKGKKQMALVVSAVLLVVEAEMLFTNGQEDGTRIIMILPVTFFLLFFLQDIGCGKLPTNIPFGGLSLLVYCFHPMVCLPFNNMGIGTIAAFAASCACSILFAYMMVCLKNKINKCPTAN